MYYAQKVTSQPLKHEQTIEEWKLSHLGLKLVYELLFSHAHEQNLLAPDNRLFAAKLSRDLLFIKILDIT